MKLKVVGVFVIVLVAAIIILAGGRRSAAGSVSVLTDAEMSGLRGGIFNDCHAPEDNCPAAPCEVESITGSRLKLATSFSHCGYGWHNCEWDPITKADCRTVHYYNNTNCTGAPDDTTHVWEPQCLTYVPPGPPG